MEDKNGQGKINKEYDVMQVLLEADPEKVKMPIGKIEIKRLSEALGKPVYFTCKAVPVDKYNNIQKDSVKYDDEGGIEDIEITDTQIFTIIEGTIKPNFKNNDLMKHYGAPTPKELVKKILPLPGEINHVYKYIKKLSGDRKDIIQEIKNE